MDHIERNVIEHMQRQRGLITLGQCGRLGFGPGQVRQRLRSGRWVLVAPSTYAVAGMPITWEHHALAVTLGPRADVLPSHRTAAALALLGTAPNLPEVTVPYGCSSRSPVALVHRARVAPIDRTVLRGVPCTAVPRTILDCAAVVQPERLRALVNSAMHQYPWLTSGLVEDAWERAQRRPGRKGSSSLDTALDDWRSTIRAESPAENRLIQLIVAWGYPEPQRQLAIYDADGELIARVDAGWAPQRIAIEYDSERWHGPDRWSHDLDREQRIRSAGWEVVRADKADLRPGERAFRDALDRAWATAHSQLH